MMNQNSQNAETARSRRTEVMGRGTDSGPGQPKAAREGTLGTDNIIFSIRRS
jgi:hypothetical protein